MFVIPSWQAKAPAPQACGRKVGQAISPATSGFVNNA
jgi:hypothetical protein